MTSDKDLFYEFEQYFRGIQKLTKSQIETFLKVATGHDTSTTIANKLKKLELNGYIKHSKGATWMNLSHEKEEEKKLIRREERRKEAVADPKMEEANNKIVTDWWVKTGKNKLDPEYCPKGIRRIIKHGALSDYVKEQCLEWE